MILMFAGPAAKAKQRAVDRTKSTIFYIRIVYVQWVLVKNFEFLKNALTKK